jgi:hypothetical protein
MPASLTKKRRPKRAPASAYEERMKKAQRPKRAANKKGAKPSKRLKSAATKGVSSGGSTYGERRTEMLKPKRAKKRVAAAPKKKKPLTKEETRKVGLTGGADKRGYTMRTTRLNTNEFKKRTDPNKKILVPPRDVVDGEIQKYGYKLKKKKKKTPSGRTRSSLIKKR